MRSVAFLTFVLLLVRPGAVRAEDPAPKKRLAVLDFDNAGVQGGPVSPFFQMRPPNVGKTVVDLLINRLVRDDSCSVIERSAIDRLLSEQNLTNSDRFDAQTAAKLGRLLGVDAIVLGTITQYDKSDKTTGSGHGLTGRSALTTKHDLKGSVQITARVVSPDTAEILAVAQGAGASEKKGVKVDLRDRSALMMGQSGAAAEVINDAVDKAVVDLSAHLEVILPKLPSRFGVIEGLVADANPSGRLILNVGSRAGAKPGDRLQVWKAGKPVRDPETQKVLRYDDTLLGEAVINSVDEVSAVATYTGSQQPSPGDRVKSFPKQ